MTKQSAAVLLTDEQRKIAVNLFRYTLWANSMMNNFEMVLERDYEEIKHRLDWGQTKFDSRLVESEMYHCLWFGVLYTVVDGWPKLKVRDQTITELLRSPYRQLLRKFRNATFHPEDYDDDRIKDLMATGQNSIDWARALTKEFKTFFINLLFHEAGKGDPPLQYIG